MLLVLTSEILAQVPGIEALKSGAHLISGVVGLLILFISVVMHIASFGLGVEVIGRMVLAGFGLIMFDLAIQGLINWLLNVGSLSLESAIRDFVILVIGAFVGIYVKENLLAYFIGLGILSVTILLWGLPGLVERCAGYCFFLKYL